MALINPEEVIYDLPLEKDMSAADFGCGSGGWVIPLAQRLENGVVYAIDILEEPISALRGKLNRQGLANVKTIKQNIEDGVDIRDNRVDLVLMTNFLFQLDEKEKGFEEARRILRGSGFVFVTEWLPDSPIGPHNLKLSPKEVKELAKNENFILKEEYQLGAHQYGFLYQK